jgi:hypothetical protein
MRKLIHKRHLAASVYSLGLMFAVDDICASDSRWLTLSSPSFGISFLAVGRQIVLQRTGGK